MQKITSMQLVDTLNTKHINILDVRSEEKYGERHITHSNVTCINIPKANIFNMKESDFTLPDSLSKEDEIIVTCTTGNSATKCATILSKKGYNVTVLDGGITSWIRQMNQD